MRIIVPSTAGSPWDPMAHPQSRRSPGAGFRTAVRRREQVGRDQNDRQGSGREISGSALGVMFMPHTLVPGLFPEMPYDTRNDLVP
ncbi:hypothetical protein LJR084_003509 [Variovorax sp. LjRoot84]